jgi:MFS superfamily sulfate permease-like transporter
MGVPVAGDTTVAEVVSVLSRLDAVHVPTLLMSAGVLLLLVVSGWVVPKLPMPLVAVSLAATVAALFTLDRWGIGTVGALPQGLPVPGIPAVGVPEITALAIPAAGVALVAFCDDLLTARAFGDRGRDPVDADQELVALGAANIAAGLLHGFPESSSGSRTVIGESAGGRSQLSSLVSAVAVVAVLIAAGSLLATLPQAAPGALVVYAAGRLVRVGEYRRFARFRWTELAIAVLATVAVVWFGVLNGVLVAVLLSVLDLVRRVSRPRDGILGFVPGLAGMHDIDDHPDATTLPGLVVYRYDAPSASPTPPTSAAASRPPTAPAAPGPTASARRARRRRGGCSTTPRAPALRWSRAPRPGTWRGRAARSSSSGAPR